MKDGGAAESSSWGSWKLTTLGVAMRDPEVTRPAFAFLFCILEDADKRTGTTELSNSVIRSKLRMSDSTQLGIKKLLKRLGYIDYKEGRYRRGKGGVPTVFTFPQVGIDRRRNVVLDGRIVAAEQPNSSQKPAIRKNRSKPPGRRVSLQEPASRKAPLQFAGNRPHSLQEPASITPIPEEKRFSGKDSLTGGETRAREGQPAQVDGPATTSSLLAVPKQGAFAKAALAEIVSSHVAGCADLELGKALVERMGGSARHFERRLATFGLSHHELGAIRTAAFAAAERVEELRS